MGDSGGGSLAASVMGEALRRAEEFPWVKSMQSLTLIYPSLCRGCPTRSHITSALLDREKTRKRKRERKRESIQTYIFEVTSFDYIDIHRQGCLMSVYMDRYRYIACDIFVSPLCVGLVLLLQAVVVQSAGEKDVDVRTMDCTQIDFIYTFSIPSCLCVDTPRERAVLFCSRPFARTGRERSLSLCLDVQIQKDLYVFIHRQVGLFVSFSSIDTYLQIDLPGWIFCHMGQCYSCISSFFGYFNIRCIYTHAS